MRVSEWLRATAEDAPDRPALVSSDTTTTYGQLDREVELMARKLTAVGVRPGDVVATSLGAGLELVTLIHAAIRTGAAVAPLVLRVAKRCSARPRAETPTGSPTASRPYRAARSRSDRRGG